MLEKANLIADYWKTWIHSSELIAVLPALNIGEEIRPEAEMPKASSMKCLVTLT